MISIIILNYNTAPLTCRLVHSVFRHLPEGTFEVIVVDNHSHEADRRELDALAALEGVRIYDSRANVGFGTGNNFGANLARGEYLCFINSDCLLTEDCLTPLCRYLEGHSDVGCIVPQQYRPDGSPYPSFSHPPGLRRELVGKHLLERLCPRRYPRRKGVRRERPFDVLQVHGCLMLFPADKFWAVGGFDVNLFLYYEEYDIGLRLRRRGWRSVVHPQYAFSHLHAASTRAMRSLSRREHYISKMYAYRKHHNLLLSTLFRIVNIVKLCFKPRGWYILPVVLRGEALSRSMRHQRF